MRLRSGIKTSVDGGADEEDMSSAGVRKSTSNGSRHRNANGSSKSGEHSTDNDHKTKSNINGKSNLHADQTPSGEKLDESEGLVGRCSMMFLKTITFIFVFMYFFVPLIVILNPWVLKEFVFLRFVQWPPFINLKDPAELGLNTTRVFTIPSESNITLGAWHVLPHSYQDKKTDYSDQEYLTALNDGKPIFLYCHGTAGSRAAWHRRQLYTLLSSLDAHVIAFDYRGYADSSDITPSEIGVVTDTMFVFDWIRHQAPKSKIFVWGHSLGTGISTKATLLLTKSGAELDGLILESPFTNAQAIATEHPMTRPFSVMPYFDWIFLETLKQQGVHFKTDINIRSVEVPILVMHAEDDALIPFYMAVKVYDSAVESKRDVKFVKFEAGKGYYHKHIHKAPELPGIIRKFTNIQETPGAH